MISIPAIEVLTVVLATGLVLAGGFVLAPTASLPSPSRLGRAVALAAFDDRVSASGKRDTYRDRLRAARIDTTYRQYAATTLLYATLAALAGGVFVAVSVVVVLSSPTVLPSLMDVDPVIEMALSDSSPVLVTLVSTVFGSIGAVLAAVSVHQFRWWLPGAQARARKRRIDLTFSRTVTLMYALSRGEVAVPEIMGTLRRHRGVYGAAADELGVAVRDMDLLGADVLTAVERVGQRTPSERFAVFCENLVTVLQSGGSTSRFLRDQYERHQQRVETRQSQFLEWLATFAEIYVSVLVVGPLLLITVLLVMGLTSGGVMTTLSVLVYLLIPLSNLGFVLALDRFTGPLRFDASASRGSEGRLAASGGENPTGTSDTGNPATDPPSQPLTKAEMATIDRIENADRARGVRSALADPLDTVLDRPTKLLSLTLPVALCWLAARLWFLSEEGALSVAVIDDTLVGVGILLTATFALVHGVHRRRIERIERAVPELLDRLASLNEVGISVVSALDRLGDSDLGELNAEIDRIRRDITLGATVSDALMRFDERLRTASVTRVVALVTNAMRASGDVAPVLRVAAEESRHRRTRKRKRRQEMATYLVIIYLSFLVFLTIVFVLVTVFMPAIPSPAALGVSSAELGTNGIGGRAVGLTNAQKDAYVRLLFHAAAIQGTASGFVAGQMARGDLADGAKHAAIMLALAYGTFLLFV